ncbi:MAG: radical SAM-associated putative lipoprotein [Tannerellaceae bacterium]|nr:radical SAM-associated putative lipoprotein [Tannerellaceae bacterium]
MKNLNHLFIKNTTWLFTGILSLFGFSCSDSNDPHDNPVEYGSPHAYFRIKRKVVNETDQEALSNIQVEIRYDARQQDPASAIYYRDTIRTDIHGEFQWDTHKITLWHMPLKLITSDPGENPGRGPFVPDTTLINFESADMQDPGSWYEGSGEKNHNPVKATNRKTGESGTGRREKNKRITYEKTVPSSH